ncbi:PAS domain-containing protein [Verrucomicrobiaceae bacterium 5K15]|uniref:histidine kinase n=1 Tax=Oceaniferula flava TaxID=2800421 RepID=A0AAE2SA38_9BACT|nr:ATP-binding protein [Oceaniferula flavus]MBK1854206.1 PAS domain-containing protein [Oceaniferula flavus]MBM1135512.1 PAS domain-containing protein [Oceaniferula flavus]
MKPGFLDKLIARLDQVDPSEVQRLVTRLVREKGFLESVFEALQEGVLILDPEGQITYVNQAASSIFGIDPIRTIGQNLSKTVRGLNWKKLADPKRIVSRDLEILYPESRYLNFYLSPIQGEVENSDRLLGYVLLVRDITDSRLEEEKNVESEKLNALTLLAAGVAHEIGNPLNSLDIHLQLLERKTKKLQADDQESLLQHLHTAQGEIRRLDTILKQFLQAIRPTHPERAPHQLHDLLRDTLNLLAPELEERHVRISLDLADSTPLLQLDGNQIKQALYNLLKNAFQSLPASGGQIDILTGVTDYEVMLTIRDHGSGIPPEMMGSIFEPYRSSKKSGTGLGLLIVRRIIREHGGDIKIESEEDEGTTVTISIPRKNRNVRLLETNDSSVIDLEPSHQPPANS